MVSTFHRKNLQRIHNTKHLKIYLDDILIYTKGLQEHIIETKNVLNHIKNRFLKTSGEKSSLLNNQIEFLGQIVTNGEIRPHPCRAECITNMPKPTTLLELQRVLGMTNYCRTYIPNYAELVRP